jgi:hypothetical protein
MCLGPLAGLLVIFALGLLPGCGGPATPPPPRLVIHHAVAGGPHWEVSSARRQVSFVPIPMALPGPLASLTLSIPTGPGTLDITALSLFAQRSAEATIESPVGDQLRGAPRITADTGSTLIPVPMTVTPDRREFTIPANTGVLFLRIDLPATVEPGAYKIPITLNLKEQLRQPLPPIDAQVDLTVSDITLPMEAPTSAIASCTIKQLNAIYPTTFGVMEAKYLDRGDAAQAAPMAQLDALTQAAHVLGISFYVEDLVPDVTVDEVGRVLVDWDAYDRTVGPYLDGTGFPDRTGHAVWLVPAPPRRVRDVPTQLKQYWKACLEHAKDRGWAAAPVLLHPALQHPDENPEATRLALGVVRQSIDKDVLVVAAPDVDIPQRKIWTTDDNDARLPAVGAYATAESVRIWPWMARARKLGGFLWPNCIGEPGADDPNHVALLIPTEPVLPPPAKNNKLGATPILPASEPLFTLRMAWLNAGMNDVAHFALLERRSDPARAAEVLAAIVGRTGLGDAMPACPDEAWRSGSRAFLNAGWPANQETWDQIDSRLDQLIVAATPGAAVTLAEDDPSYLQTKIWLARSHQLIARVGGYRFGVDPSRDGPLLKASIDMLLENPINLQTPIAVQHSALFGDFQAQTPGELQIAPYALTAQTLVMQGHLESAHGVPPPIELSLQEKVGGAEVRLPVGVPLFKMHATREPPKLDAKLKDWPEESGPSTTMPVALRYLNRPNILRSQVQAEDVPATVRWCYDSDFIYALIQCPQSKVDDERNNDWPEQNGRWWGQDAVQIQISGGAKVGDNTHVIEIAMKPSGAMLLRQAVLKKDQPVTYNDTPAAVKYSIHADGKGYVAQVAIPRKLFPADHDKDADTPVWRINVLRHIREGAISTSWSGPIRDDADFSMMGLLVGQGE